MTKKRLLHRMPAWMKAVAILAGLFFVFSILGAISQHLIAPLLIGLLILFQGKDRTNPWLFKVVPWLWSLSFLIACALLVAEHSGKSLLGPEMRTPSSMELWTSIVFFPFLMATFLKRQPTFKPVLIVSTLTYVGIEAWVYVGGEQNLNANLEFYGDLAAELLLTGYLLLKFKPVKKPR